MNKIKFCTLYFDQEIADAIMKAPVLSDYEKSFDRRVTRAERVERIIHIYLEEKSLLKKDTKQNTKRQ